MILSSLWLVNNPDRWSLIGRSWRYHIAKSVFVKKDIVSCFPELYGFSDYIISLNTLPARISFNIIYAVEDIVWNAPKYEIV